VVPRVEFAVRGIGFGNPVSFCIVSVCPRAVAGQFVIIAGRVSVAVGGDTVAIGIVNVRFVSLIGVVRANELAEEVIVVGRLAVDGVEVFDDVVGFVICVTVFDDLTSSYVAVCDGADGIVRVVGIEKFTVFLHTIPPEVAGLGQLDVDKNGVPLSLPQS